MIGNVLGLLRCLSKASHLIYIIIDLFPVISVSIAKVFERIVYDQFYSVLTNEDKGCVLGGKSKSGFPNPKTDFAFFWANHESIKSTLRVDSSDQIQIRIF